MICTADAHGSLQKCLEIMYVLAVTDYMTIFHRPDVQPVVLKRVPGGPQLNDGEWVPNSPL